MIVNDNTNVSSNSGSSGNNFCANTLSVMSLVLVYSSGGSGASEGSLEPTSRQNHFADFGSSSADGFRRDGAQWVGGTCAPAEPHLGKDGAWWVGGTCTPAEPCLGRELLVGRWHVRIRQKSLARPPAELAKRTPGASEGGLAPEVGTVAGGQGALTPSPTPASPNCQPH